jgi:DNA-binding transcriptional MerR regulator
MGNGSGWTVGDLAQATGLSQRVLRHWERLGLVTPARNPSGHRRYGPGEITRLYRALALRQAGLRLGQIKTLLDTEDPGSAAATLRAHLAALDADLHRRGLLRDRLAAALGAMDEPGRPGRPPAEDAELLMKVIETMTMFDGYVHGYRTEENARLHDQAGTLPAAPAADRGRLRGRDRLPADGVRRREPPGVRRPVHPRDLHRDDRGHPRARCRRRAHHPRTLRRRDP